MEQEQDSIELTGSGGLSYKEIVLNQFRKITDLCNVEFRGGFYTTFINTKGEEKELYVPDTREVLCNAIYGLTQLLISKFDKEMTKAFQEFEELKEQNEKAFMDFTKMQEEVVLGERYYEDIKEKIALETYKTKKLQIHQYLFTQLSLLLSRLNFLEFGGQTFK